MTFEGIPRDGIKFLKTLKRNNKRTWFQPRKETYEKLLRDPLALLVTDLGANLGKKYPHFRFDPKKSIFRIYRDVRFSANKAPYKTHISAYFSQRSMSGVDLPGLYLHVEPGRVFAAGGLYMPSSTQLSQIRYCIDKDSTELKKIIRARRFKNMFKEMAEDKLKRAPKGYPIDHPDIELLKTKHFVYSREFRESEIHSPKFSKSVTETYLELKPYLDWLERSTRI